MELVVALGIVGLIAGTTGMMLNSVADGTSGEQDGRRHLVRTQAVSERLATTIHSCQTVLAAGNGYLVYWVNDANCDNAVQLDELGLLERDPTTGELRVYRAVFPNWFAPWQRAAANSTYATNTNWYAAAQTAKGGYLAPTTVAANVSAFVVSVDNPLGPSMATCTFTLGSGRTARTATVAASIRSPLWPS